MSFDLFSIFITNISDKYVCDTLNTDTTTRKYNDLFYIYKYEVNCKTGGSL